MVSEAMRIFSILFSVFAVGLGLMFLYGLFNLMVAVPHEEPKADPNAPRPGKGRRTATG